MLCEGPLPNGIKDINKLFTKWRRTSVFCLTPISIFVSLCLPRCPLFHFFSPSLIPNQRDGPRKYLGAEYKWAQLPNMAYWALSMGKFIQTQACSEKTVRVNTEGYASTYVSACPAFADTSIFQAYAIPLIYRTRTHMYTECERQMLRL